MRYLLVLRHAKSSWDDPTADDHARPLNERGRRDAPRMGALIRELRLQPDVVMSSNATRARMTAEAAAAAAGQSSPVRIDPRLYLASAADIIHVLRTAVEDTAGTVMIVGHNPGLEELVTRLTGEREELPTAALVQIELPIERWSDLDAATGGTLLGLWRPREIA